MSASRWVTWLLPHGRPLVKRSDWVGAAGFVAVAVLLVLTSHGAWYGWAFLAVALLDVGHSVWLSLPSRARRSSGER